METFRIVQVMLLYVLIVTIQTDDLCDPTNGAPSNGEYCILIPNYDTYQIAECGQSPFTTTSNKIETCADSCRDYCWLPCMVKEFDQHNGTVDPACACQGDRVQMCANATGSVKYYTECLNKTLQCPSPSYVDFADFYFNRLSDAIVMNDACPLSAQKRAFRLCVETTLRSMVDEANNCGESNEPFVWSFHLCLNQHAFCNPASPLLIGIDMYLTENSQPWFGASVIRSMCDGSGQSFP